MAPRTRHCPRNIGSRNASDLLICGSSEISIVWPGRQTKAAHPSKDWDAFMIDFRTSIKDVQYEPICAVSMSDDLRDLVPGYLSR